MATSVTDAGTDRVFSDIEISENLIRRFDVTGPRYTSYPTADRFSDAFTATTYKQYLAQRLQAHNTPPLSVYVHLPFCQSLCYFCACNKIITQDTSRIHGYLDYIEKELALLDPHLGDKRFAEQLHFGGGTPTFGDNASLDRLMEVLRRHFSFSETAQLSIEIDPRTIDDSRLQHLAALGFNRTSFGVQDFDPDVQRAVNRIQPYSMVERALESSRRHGFGSINLDLIYGLPKQSVKSFEKTLDRVVHLRPDRIALYNYAHLPNRFKAQRLIHEQDLPSAEARLQIFLMATCRLLDAGYVYIGLDHFALPDDELSLARKDGSLHRNFQGYTTHAQCDLIGLGLSAIGKVGGCYSQSAHSLRTYTEQLDEGRLPVSKGLELSKEDQLRGQIIMTVMCSMRVDFQAIARDYDIDFNSVFASELQRLQPYEAAGLLTISDTALEITPKGRLFVRAIGMVFDAWLGKPTVSTYSKLI